MLIITLQKHWTFRAKVQWSFLTVSTAFLTALLVTLRAQFSKKWFVCREFFFLKLQSVQIQSTSSLLYKHLRQNIWVWIQRSCCHIKCGHMRQLFRAYESCCLGWELNDRLACNPQCSASFRRHYKQYPATHKVC